jgi:crossover junction endodeoxyribonuclease RuvC
MALGGLMRVLGIDPGLTRCGVAVISGAPGRRLEALHIGVITTHPDLPLPERLLLVERELEAIVVEYEPLVVAVERVFSQHNVRSAMGTAQAAAMGFLVAARHGIPVATHTPTEVKAAVTGNGRADKAQVTAMVTRILQLPAPPKPADAADAVAIAVCHVWRGSAQAKINAALAAVAR